MEKRGWVMSKIDELITELCPDGVEYRKLGDISRILRGKRLTKNTAPGGWQVSRISRGLEPDRLF